MSHSKLADGNYHFVTPEELALFEEAVAEYEMNATIEQAWRVRKMRDVLEAVRARPGVVLQSVPG